MKQTRVMWDMPITVELRDAENSEGLIDAVYSYFQHVDDTFSTFKPTSEISRINRKELVEHEWSADMREVVALCEQTRIDTRGFFSYIRDGEIHPLGLVKGWALHKAADMLRGKGVKNFFIEAGGDVEISGVSAPNVPWSVGIRDPFYRKDIVKKLLLTDCGVATSGTYIRGYHIYNPFAPDTNVAGVTSLTVVGPNAYEADRFVTPAFAMGIKGVEFIETVGGLEGYQIDARGMATFTSGFERYVDH